MRSVVRKSVVVRPQPRDPRRSKGKRIIDRILADAATRPLDYVSRWCAGRGGE